MRVYLVGVAIVTLGINSGALAQSLRICSWNAEGCDDGSIRQFLGSIQCDIFGLCSLKGSDPANGLELAADAGWEGGRAAFEALTGKTGGRSRIAILFNTETLQKESDEELTYAALGADVSAPLVARFVVRRSGKKFLFVMNQFNARNAEIRRAQAYVLNDWVRRQEVAVIAAGDFSFNWALEAGSTQHDAAYDALVAGKRLEWVKPLGLIATRPGEVAAVHDFVFVGGYAQEWFASSAILAPDYFGAKLPEKALHRPIEASLQLDRERDPPPAEAGPEIERELADLERLVRELPEASRKPIEQAVARLRQRLAAR